MELLTTLPALSFMLLAVGVPVTVTILLLCAAFVTIILSALGKCPIWIPVLLVLLTVMLMVLPR